MLMAFATLAILASADLPSGKEEIVDFVVAGRFDKDSPRDRINGWPTALHAIRLEKDRVYSIEVTGANFTPYLRVENSSGAPLGQGQNRDKFLSRLRLTPANEGVVLICVSGHGMPEGNYSLLVKPYLPGPVKLFPLPAPTAKQPAAADGILGNDDSPDQYRDFPGKIHTVELTAGKVYVIDLMSKQFDAYLLLQNENGGLIAQDDDSGGNLNSRIRFQPKVSGRYRVIASTYNGRLGAYSLRVREE